MKNQWKIVHYLRRIMGLLPRRRKKQFGILLAAMVAVAVLETISLAILSVFATSISSPEEVLKSDAYQKVMSILRINRELTPESLIVILSVVVVIAVIIKNAATGTVRYWVSRFGATVQGHVGEMILRKYLEVDYEWHLSQNPHDLLVTLTWRNNIGLFVNSSLNVVSNLVLVVIMMTSIVVIQPVLMPFMILVLGIAAFYIFKFIRKRIDRAAKNVVHYTKTSTLDGAKTIHGMKDVRIFGLDKGFLGDYSDKVFKLSRYIAAQTVLATVPTWIMEAVGFFFLSSAILIMIFVMKLRHVEVFATLSLLAVAAWRVLPAINRIISGLSNICINYPFIDRVYEVVDDIDSVKGSPITESFSSVYESHADERTTFFNESMKLVKVSFKYSRTENYALRDINCEIRKGASVGIVGHSGAGKSTLIDLIIGMLRPSEGSIYLDGQELDEANVKRWRSKIGYVPQFPYIYDCSIAENIAFGETLDTLDEERVLAACKQASIDFLDELDDGIYSRIGDRGSMISGGQRQRVAIARALYRDPEVIVFDEATSSLDNLSEKAIQETIENLEGEQTKIIIAHRLSTVENCDYLIWLEQGGLVGIDEPSKILPDYLKMHD